jgi:hypothetical protein
MITWRTSKHNGTMKQSQRKKKQKRITNSATSPKKDGKVCQPFFLKLELELKQTV